MREMLLGDVVWKTKLQQTAKETETDTADSCSPTSVFLMRQAGFQSRSQSKYDIVKHFVMMMFVSQSISEVFGEAQP